MQNSWQDPLNGRYIVMTVIFKRHASEHPWRVINMYIIENMKVTFYTIKKYVKNNRIT